MQFYKHKSYVDYVKAQVSRNKASQDVIWIRDSCVRTLSKYILQNIPDVQQGICHGVRTGWEVKAFRKALKCDVIGTEISPTASESPHVIQWDFHDVKDEWINNIDFIYSNAFDHSYDPEKCLDIWMSCIKCDGGMCFIEYHKNVISTPEYKESGVSPSDCFNADKDEYAYMISKKYRIKDDIVYDRKKSKRKNKITKGDIFVIEHPRNE